MPTSLLRSITKKLTAMMETSEEDVRAARLARAANLVRESPQEAAHRIAYLESRLETLVPTSPLRSIPTPVASDARNKSYEVYDVRSRDCPVGVDRDSFNCREHPHAVQQKTDAEIDDVRVTENSTTTKTLSANGFQQHERLSALVTPPNQSASCERRFASSRLSEPTSNDADSHVDKSSCGNVGSGSQNGTTVHCHVKNDSRSDIYGDMLELTHDSPISAQRRKRRRILLSDSESGIEDAEDNSRKNRETRTEVVIGRNADIEKIPLSTSQQRSEQHRSTSKSRSSNSNQSALEFHGSTITARTSATGVETQEDSCFSEVSDVMQFRRPSLRLKRKRSLLSDHADAKGACLSERNDQRTSRVDSRFSRREAHLKGDGNGFREEGARKVQYTSRTSGRNISAHHDKEGRKFAASRRARRGRPTRLQMKMITDANEDNEREERFAAGSSIDGLDDFVVSDDDDISFEDADDVLEKSQEGDRHSMEKSLHPPEHSFSAPGAGKSTIYLKKLSLRQIFRIYVKAHILSFLDSEFRDALIYKHGSQQQRFGPFLDQARCAVVRVEQDIMKRKAVEFVADGRWRSIHTALDHRPFMTVFHDQLDILPQPIDLQGNAVTYCNGCNHRPSSRLYHDPKHTVVLHGPKVDEVNSRQHWPECLQQTGDEVVLASDVRKETLSASELKKRYGQENARKWWRDHSSLSPSQSCTDESGSGSDDEENIAVVEKPEGFGIAPECLQKCSLYHEMVWFRFHIARVIRERMIMLMNEQLVGLEPTSRDFIVGVLMLDEKHRRSGELGKKYGLMNNLRNYANDLITKSQISENKKKSQSQGRLDAIEFESEDERLGNLC